MKEYKFNVAQIYLNDFFTPIRSKAHVIEVLMHALKYMLLNPTLSDDEAAGSLVLKVDKMSRLFFITEEKYFSIAFPFYVTFDENKYYFKFQNLLEIDSRLISQVLAIIQCDEFKATCSLDFISPICEYEEECDENFWLFLRELLLMEDGYIRYDYDVKNENGHAHPLNHYDLFYSSNATFKLGLKEKNSIIEFVDILDINTSCMYLTKPSNER